MHGIGERVLDALRRRRLTPETLAARAGVDVPVVRDALDRDRLRADQAPRLAAALGVEPGWLLYGEIDFERAPARGADDAADTADEQGDAVPAPRSPARAARDAEDAADADDDAGEAEALTQVEAVARVLRALPDGERGRALKLALLDALDASAREQRVTLPLAVRGFRARVNAGAL